MLYWDNAASSRPSEAALKRFEDISLNSFANPSSKHFFGFEASKLVENARKNMLSACGIEATHSLVFTSGATESNNLAIKGIAERYSNRGRKILVSSVEHPSVLETARALKEKGFEVLELPVNKDGVVTPEILSSYIDKDTILVSIMGVNNETGSIFPISELSKITHKFPKCFFHSDLTQAIGKTEIPWKDLDLASFSSHKFGGLKGCGGMFFAKKIRFMPQIEGGGQENGLRSGTLNAAGIAATENAFLDAVDSSKDHIAKEKGINLALREELSKIDEISFNSPLNGSSFILNFSLLKHKASVIVEALSEKGIYVSSVSACSSKGEPISYVLTAMGKSEREAANSIRLSPGVETTESDIELFISTLKQILKEVRPL